MRACRRYGAVLKREVAMDGAAAGDVSIDLVPTGVPIRDASRVAGRGARLSGSSRRVSRESHMRTSHVNTTTSTSRV